MKRIRDKLIVVLLAGGEGRRIGGSKPLRMFEGRTLLDRALEIGRSWSDEVVLALRKAGQVGPVNIQAVVDDDDLAGPVAGLAAGLRYAERVGRPFALTLPCDMPFIPADLPQRLMEAAGEGRSAAIASSGGVLHPVCALWRTSALQELPVYLATGKRSLRGFAEHVGFAQAAWEDRPFDPFFNINCEQDLQEAERLLRF